MASNSNDSGFLRYLAAFTKNWFTAVSGGLSVPAAIAGLRASTSWQKTLWGFAALAAVMVASYSVWLKKCRELQEVRDDLEKERAKNTRPTLKGSIEQIYVKLCSPEKLQGDTRCDVEAFVKATLYNESNCPTTIRSFGLTVQDAEGTHESEYLRDASSWLIQRGEPYQDSVGQSLGSDPEDLTALDVDTTAVPVALGRHREGWLHFIVMNISPSSPEKGSYCLTAIDSFGTQHKICCRENPPRGTGQVMK